MALSLSTVVKESWWNKYVDSQLSVRVCNKTLSEEELKTSTKVFTEKSFNKAETTEEITSLEFVLSVAWIIEKSKEHTVTILTYRECFTTFYAIILDNKFVMDIVRENICLHFEKSHYDEKVCRLRRFYEEGIETLRNFQLRHPETNFFLLGRPTIADESLEEFLEAKIKFNMF